MAKPDKTDAPAIDDPNPAAAEAAEREATGVTDITLTWNDEEWTIPPSLDEAPATALLALEQGRGVSFVQAMLGTKQWRRFAVGSKSSAKDASDFMVAIMNDGYGASLGE